MKEFFLRVVEALRRVWIRVQVRFFTMLSIILFLGVSLLIFERTTYSESRAHLSLTLESFAEKYSQMLELMNWDPKKLDSVDRERLGELFRDPLYANTGYPFVVEMTGRIDFHFFRDGVRLPWDVLDQMASSPGRKGSIRISFTGNKNQEREIVYTYIRDLNCFLAIELTDEIFDAPLNAIRVYSWILFLLGSVLIWLVLSYYTHREKRLYKVLQTDLSDLAQGILPERASALLTSQNEDIASPLNRVIEGLAKTTSFVRHLASNDLSQEYTPMGVKDELGNSLLDLRSSLLKQEVEAARIKEEERVRSWSNEGLAEFAKLLRENSNDIAQLSDIILKRIVNYLGATHGALYILEEQKTRSVLQLVSAFAYDRKKYLRKQLDLGEGLVGTCAIEREIVHIDVLPPEYCDITSGIGSIPPKELLLVPLKTDDALLGVLELASLNVFAPYMVNFARLLSVSIAQTLQQVVTNQRTAELLRQSQEQREAMRSQEEEMRQNLEEMQATQEEMTRRTQEYEILSHVMEQTTYYAEFLEDGALVQGNQQFENSLHRVGFMDLSEFHLLKQAELTSLTVGHSDSLRSLWDKILAGNTQKCALRVRGIDDEVLFYASFTSLAHDGSTRVYMVAQVLDLLPSFPESELPL